MSATIDKIRKLLNLANNAGSAPNEAETARILAERLMNAAGIRETDLADDGNVDPIETFSTTDIDAPEVGWHGVLAVAVSRVVGCFVHRTSVYRRDLGKVITVRRWVGTAAQRDAAIELHAWVVAQVERLANGARKVAAQQPSPRAYLGAYRRGLASAIAGQAMRIAQSKTPPVDGSAALVRLSAIEQKIDEYKKHNKLGKGVGKGSYRTSAVGAFHAGRNDGQSVRLQRDVAGSGVKRLGSGS